MSNKLCAKWSDTSVGLNSYANRLGYQYRKLLSALYDVDEVNSLYLCSDVA